MGQTPYDPFGRAEGPPSPWRRLWQLLRPHGLRLGVVVFTLFVLAAANMAVPAIIGYLFNEVFPDRLWSMLGVCLLGMVGVYLVRNVLYYMSKQTAVDIGEAVCFGLRKELFEQLQLRSISYYRDRNPGELSSRVMDDSTSIQTFIADELPKLLQAACLGIGLCIVIYAVNWPLAVVATLVLPLHLWAFAKFKDPIKRNSRDAQRQTASVYGSMIEKFLGIEVVKGFAAEERENEAFVAAIDRSRRSQLAMKKSHVLQKVAADLIVGIGTVALLGFGGYQVMKNSDAAMKPGTFIAFFAYVGMLYPTILMIMTTLAKLAKTGASLERVGEVLDDREAESHGGRPVSRPIRGRVRFQWVGYKYGPHAPQVLENVNLDIRAGQVAVVMGPSGAGKSTLLSLIPRFRELEHGYIFIDGYEVRSVNTRALRKAIGVAFQECFLFNASILENLRYASPNASIGQIARCAKLAGAHDFIKRLPDRYDTLLGEGGITLSRGEKQRLVLARALLQDPRVLIMDEATASLDRATERRVIPAILEHMRGRTVLMATHRAEMLQYADTVIALDQGGVVYHGPPRHMPDDVRELLGVEAEHEPPAGRRERLVSVVRAGLIALAALLGSAALAPGEARAQLTLPKVEVTDTDDAGGLVPMPGVTEVALDEMFDVFATHLQTRLGYRTANAETAALLPEPAAKMNRLILMSREVKTEAGEPATRLLQVGFRTFQTQSPHVWVHGETFVNGGERVANPDVPVAMRLLRGVRGDVDARFEELKVGDLESRIVKLSYVEADRCVGMLKALGYETIEFSDPAKAKAPGASSVIDPTKPVDATKLPIIISMPGSDATKLPGGSSVTKGTFGLGMTPTVASDLPDATNAAPLMRLMVLYHPNRPEQLAALIHRIKSTIDLPARQILMEAMVLEISETGLKQLGVEWELESPGGNLDSLVLGRLPLGLDATSSTLDIGLRNVFGEFAVRIKALIREGQAEILSRPSVLTLDNRQASIRVGEEIPVATSIAGTRSTDKLSFNFEYIPVGILLNIRPRVSDTAEHVSVQIDGIVSDEVPGEDVEIRDEEGQLLASAPRISTRRVQTHIRIANNTPFIIGGLVARDDITVEEKVPLLGDIPLIGMAFRNTSTRRLRNEVIIVITPFVLPDEGIVGRNLPKDEDAFDSFGNDLFRDAYRIRTEDVFDLAFIQENEHLRFMQGLAEDAVARDVRLATQYPYNRFVDRHIPGEEIFVYRQMYEVVKRLKIDQNIDSQKMIFFRPDDRWAAGFSVTFLHKYLRDLVGLSDEADIGGALAALQARDQALALIYTEPGVADGPAVLRQPVPDIRVVDCDDSQAWANTLWELNQPDEQGRNRYTILLRSEWDLVRLKRAIVLKRTVELNGNGGSLTLGNFSHGRLLLMPTVRDDKVYVVDSETARYFYLTEHYYPAFAKTLQLHLSALRGALSGLGIDVPVPAQPLNLPREQPVLPPGPNED